MSICLIAVLCVMLRVYVLVQPEVSDSEKQAFIDLAGADGEIDAFELKDILNKEFKKGNQHNVGFQHWRYQRTC